MLFLSLVSHSHPTRHVGENYYNWQCRTDFQCQRMESRFLFLSWLPPPPCLPSLSLSSSLFFSLLSSLSQKPLVHSTLSALQIGWAIGPEHLVKHMQVVNANTGYTYVPGIQVGVATSSVTTTQLLSLSLSLSLSHTHTHTHRKQLAGMWSVRHPGLVSLTLTLGSSLRCWKRNEMKWQGY